MRRAVAIDERCYGPDHPEIAIDLNNLAQLLQATNRLAEAEPLMPLGSTSGPGWRSTRGRVAAGTTGPPQSRNSSTTWRVAPGHDRLAEAEPLIAGPGDRRAVVRPRPPRRRVRS